MLAPVAERPKIADAPLSVVLLASAADENLDPVVSAWRAWLDQRPGDAEILVVTDAADTRLGAAASGDPRVRVIYQVSPTGLGPCLQTAIWIVRHPLLLTAPGDWQFEPADALRLFADIDRVDFVSGCRADRPPPWWLRLLGLGKRLATWILLGYFGEPRVCWRGWRGWGRRWIARHIFGVKLADAASPLRLFRTEVLRRFPIQARGSFTHVEVAAKANYLGCWMTETPIPWQRPTGDDGDATWRADQRLVRRWPEFYPTPTLAAGVSSGDLLASKHEAEPSVPSAKPPSEPH